jgi:multisubunit Na+/H+ antiporter MnhB subunit
VNRLVNLAVLLLGLLFLIIGAWMFLTPHTTTIETSYMYYESTTYGDLTNMYNLVGLGIGLTGLLMSVTALIYRLRK